jgi:hypothetical protein
LACAPVQGTAPSQQSETADTSTSAVESVPWWHQLLIPSDSGTVATLGAYAEQDLLPPDVPRDARMMPYDDVAAPRLPWDQVGSALGLVPPDAAFIRSQAAHNVAST